jgi:PAS domain S-box-containing protein
MKNPPVSTGNILSYDNCAEDHFHTFVSNINSHAIFFISTCGLVDTWSKGAHHITGYNADEIIGKNISLIYTKKDFQKGLFDQNLARAKEQGSFESEGRCIKKDGTLFWANVIYTATFNKQHELTGYVVIIKDISDQRKNGNEQSLLVMEEIRQAQAKLRHSELRLKQAQAIAHVGSWEVDFSTHIALWSDEALRIYGLPPGDTEQSYEKWLSFIHHDDLDYVMQVIREGEATLKNYSLFHRIIRRNGEVRYLYSQTYFELNSEGKPLGLYGVAQDITEIKKAEELLKESERISRDLVAFHQKLIDASTMGIFSYDAISGKCLSVNIAAAKIIGGTPEQLLNQNFRHIQSWKEYGLLKDAEDTLLTGKIHHNEIHFITSFGKEVWFDYKFVKFVNKNQPHLLLLMNDITERKQAEDALRQSEQRYRQIVETAHEGIWLIDENNVTTFVNKRMCEILEYSQEEMLGKQNYYFMDEAGKQEALKTIKRRKQGIVESFDVRYITKGGREVLAHISANPIFDEEGNYKGSLGMISDITARKKLEDLLEKSNRLARIGSWEIDAIKGTVYWSDITKAIREADPDFEPDLATGIHYFKEGKNRDIIEQRVKECIEKGTPWDEELQIVTQKGNLKWIRTIGEAEFKNGKCIKVYGSFQDIDATKNAQIEVLKAYEEKNNILESIGDAFFTVDKNWIVTYWNKEAEKILKMPRHETTGKNIWKVWADAAGTDFYTICHKAIKENTVQNFDTFYEKLNGWFEVSAYPSSTGLSVYFRDITDKKRLQQRLLEEQMNKQKEIARAVMNAQERERTGIGEELHDNVNQLLAASRLYLNHSLSLPDGDPESVRKSMDYISSAMDELRKLSHALVGPTRDKTMGLINSIEKLINDVCLVKPIKIHFLYATYNEEESEAGLKLVIYRIIQEQLNNILKYANASEIKIELKKETEYLTVSIKDNGKGFDTSIESKGIGLKNIKHRAELFNGIVQIKSSPGNGCKMKIIFKIT